MPPPPQQPPPQNMQPHPQQHHPPPGPMYSPHHGPPPPMHQAHPSHPPPPHQNIQYHPVHSQQHPPPPPQMPPQGPYMPYNSYYYQAVPHHPQQPPPYINQPPPLTHQNMPPPPHHPQQPNPMYPTHHGPPPPQPQPHPQSHPPPHPQHPSTAQQPPPHWQPQPHMQQQHHPPPPPSMPPQGPYMHYNSYYYQAVPHHPQQAYSHQNMPPPPHHQPPPPGPIYTQHHGPPPPHAQHPPSAQPPPHWQPQPHMQQQHHPSQPVYQHQSPQPPHYHQPIPVPIQHNALPPAPLPPSASPHHPPSRVQTPSQQHPAIVTAKQQPPPPQTSTPASPAPKIEKKELTFPRNSVEATKLTNVKRRKLTSKDVSDIEMWRLVMCLKSGLLAESSWAIDVLAILLSDDSTSPHFALSNCPGLLEVVIEHYKVCLNEIYDGIVEDTILKPTLSEIKPVEQLQIEEALPEKTENVIGKRKANGICEKNQSASTKVQKLSDQMIMFKSAKNYTYKTRDGKIVKLEDASKPDDGPVVELVYGPIESYSHWREGNGEDISHIQVPRSKSSSDLNNNSQQNSAPRRKRGLNGDTNESRRKKSSSYPRVRPDEEESYKLKYQEPETEDEASSKGEQLMNHVEDNQMSLARKCACLSTILRNLSFIPGNDCEMSKHAGLLLILGRLLLLKHEHGVKQTLADLLSERDRDDSSIDFHDEEEWYCGHLNSIREDTLVIISNISSSLDLSPFNEKINFSLLEGLIHWAVCSSSYALDPIPTNTLAVSPQRLALESLAKLSIIEGNVDLILATPPWSRIEQLLTVLSRFFGSNEDQTTREFSLVLLSNLVPAGSGIARIIALKGNLVAQLISFLEIHEAKAQEVVATHGHKAIKDQPEACGTSQDMLKRAAHTLMCIANLKENHHIFSQHQQRLLSLVMSKALDSSLVSIVADVIFEISSSPVASAIEAN